MSSRKLIPKFRVTSNGSARFLELLCAENFLGNFVEAVVMQSFTLIGAAGFITIRHMYAIEETGNELVAALNPNDSVGVINSHFPDAHFFTEFERFDRYIDKCRRKGRSIDYVSICSPNNLHDSRTRFELRSGTEKPSALKP